MGIRKRLVKTFQIRDKKIPANGVAGANADLPAGRRRIQKLCFSALNQMHGRLNVAQKNFPFRGELYPFCTADKKRLIQFAFQCLDGLADCGLGNKKKLDASEKLKVDAT